MGINAVQTSAIASDKNPGSDELDPVFRAKLERSIREIPDFPKPGMTFYDITTFLKQGPLLKQVVELFAERHRGSRVDFVVGIESRGFVLAGAVAAALGVGFVPVRKFGKLPAAVQRAQYSLEYGTDTVEIHQDSVRPDDRVLLIDDLMATGGTVEAACSMLLSLEADLVECLFLVELLALNGRSKIPNIPIYSVIKY